MASGDPLLGMKIRGKVAGGRDEPCILYSSIRASIRRSGESWPLHPVQNLSGAPRGVLKKKEQASIVARLLWVASGTHPTQGGATTLVNIRDLSVGLRIMPKPTRFVDEAARVTLVVPFSP